MLEIAADAKVWKPLLELITSCTDEAVVFFEPRGITARNMNRERTAAYELFYPADGFLEYRCDKPLYAVVRENDVKRALKQKGKLTLTLDKDWLRLGNELVGPLLLTEENLLLYKRSRWLDKLPELKRENEAELDATIFSKWLHYADKAGGEYVGFSWVENLRIVATGAWGEVWIEMPAVRARVTKPSASIFRPAYILQFFPPSAITKNSYVIVDTEAKDDTIMWFTAGSWAPAGVSFRFAVAPTVESEETKKRIFGPKPKIETVARFRMKTENAKAMFDLFFSNVDKPVVQITEEGLLARNMGAICTTMAQLEVPRIAFEEYEVKKVKFVELTRDDRIRYMLRIAELLGTDAEINVTEEEVFFDRVLIGHSTDRRLDREVTAKLDSYVKLDPAQYFFKLPKEIGKAHMTEVFCVGFSYDPSWDAPNIIYYGPSGEVLDERVISGEYEVKERLANCYRLEYVQQFFPPSVKIKEAELWMSGFLFPLRIRYSPFSGAEFTAYIAAYVDPAYEYVKKRNWLKPLTEGAVIQALREAAIPPTRDRLKIMLENRFYHVEGDKLDKILKDLLNRKIVVSRTAGYLTVFTLADKPLTLKPLTEEVILEAIKRKCEEWGTDAISSSELETVLGVEYDIMDLDRILYSLYTKGLLGKKMDRKGPYAADPRGFWYIKEPEPEKVVERAEEVKKLKELTEEAVLSVIAEMHEAVKDNVKLSDVVEKLKDQEYDTTKLDEILSRLKAEGKVEMLADGRVWTAEFARKIREAPPPLPKGYVRVHFKRDMVRYIGIDRKYYGPFKACQVAVIEEKFAQVFAKHGYVEILEQSEVQGTKKSGGGWEEELADLVEIARKESLEEFLNNIRFTRTRPYSRIAAICREEYITLEDVCSKGPSEPRYSEIGELYSYARPWCGKKEVTIYRGGSEIKPGDWVALEREYAEGHGTPVYELKVPLSDVVWAGTDVKEWFYIPKRLQGLFKSSEEFWRACRSEQKPKTWEEAKKRYERWKV
jgi:hypothetical protein